MSDDKDDIDASDWLAGQFNPTEQVPKQPAAPAVPPQPVPPVFPPTPVAPAFPPAQAPAVFPPAQAPAHPVPPAAAPPAPSGDGGFNWGLRPGGSAEPPPAVQQPPAAPYVPPLAPLPAPASTALPTQAMPSPAVQYPLIPPPVSPPAVPPKEPHGGAPTRPLSWEEFAASQTQAAPPAAPLEQPTEAYTVQPWDPFAPTTPPATVPPAPVPFGGAPAEPRDPTSAIDALFGENQFQEYEELGVLQTMQPSAAPGVIADAAPREPRGPLPTSQKVLMGVAGGLVAVLAFVALFFLGTRLGEASAVQPIRASGAPTTAPISSGTGGPASPGVQPWTALQGGECIQPFTTAWAVTFTVVQCTADHDAEMVFKGTLPDPGSAPYPTANQFQAEITPLCSAPTAINYAAAASVTDLQVSYTYPANSDSWNSGSRTYYCFVNRQSGGDLPGDLSVQKGQ